jgi:glycosyltransferase involved in cell wall biosynthesis
MATEDPSLVPAGRPLLSIAIPTFQRLKWLSIGLERVLAQVAQAGQGQVEVLVSENAGADGTWDYLQEQARRHPALRVHRNERNIGAEGNFHQLPGMCRGKYVWLVGDDDFLEPGALAAALALLAGDPDFVALNALSTDEELTRAGRPLWELARDVEVHSLEECIAIVPHFVMGFISAWIARRELFNLVDKSVYDHFEHWGMSLMVDRYTTVGSSGRGIVTARPFTTARRPPPSEYGDDFNFFEWFFEGGGQVLDLMHEKGLLSADRVRRRKARTLRQVALKRILFERGARLIKRRRVNGVLWKHHRGDWAYWLLCLPALYVPGLGAAMRLVRPPK